MNGERTAEYTALAATIDDSDDDDFDNESGDDEVEGIPSTKAPTVITTPKRLLEEKFSQAEAKAVSEIGEIAHIRKVSQCMDFHRRNSHVSIEQAELMIPITRGHGLQPGDMRKYMPVCPQCVSNTFDHVQVKQRTDKSEHEWLKDALPGEHFAFDSNDMSIHAWYGDHRYATDFFDLKSTYRITVCTATLQMADMRRAIEYAKDVVPLITGGTKVKQLYSDAFSSYLSDFVSTLRVTFAIGLDVFPAHHHAYNPAENGIRIATRACRKNLGDTPRQSFS